MLTFREILSCEGYYFNLKSGDILRNVGPGETRCWSEGSWTAVSEGDLDVPRFELLTADVTAPFADVEGEAAGRYGRAASGRIVQRQTAVQPGGAVVTEQAEFQPAPPPAEPKPGEAHTRAQDHDRTHH